MAVEGVTNYCVLANDTLELLTRGAWAVCCLFVISESAHLAAIALRL